MSISKKSILTSLLSSSAIIASSLNSTAAPLVVGAGQTTIIQGVPQTYDSATVDGTLIIRDGELIISDESLVGGANSSIRFEGSNAILRGRPGISGIFTSNPIGDIIIADNTRAENSLFMSTGTSGPILASDRLIIGQDAVYTAIFGSDPGTQSSRRFQTNVQGTNGSGQLILRHNPLEPGLAVEFNQDIGDRLDSSKKLGDLRIENRTGSDLVTLSRPNGDLYIDTKTITSDQSYKLRIAASESRNHEITGQIGTLDIPFKSLELRGSYTLGGPVFLSSDTKEAQNVITMDIEGIDRDALTLYDAITSTNPSDLLFFSKSTDNNNVIFANTTNVVHNISFAGEFFTYNLRGLIFVTDYRPDLVVAGADVEVKGDNNIIRSINYTSPTAATLKIHDGPAVESIPITTTGDRIHSLEIASSDANFTGSFGTSDNYMKDMIVDGKGGHSLTISTNDFFGSIATNTDGSGTVILNSPNFSVDRAGYSNMRLGTLRTTSDASVDSINAVDLEFTGAGHVLTTTDGSVGASNVTSTGNKIHKLAVLGTDIDITGSFGSAPNPMVLTFDAANNHTATISTGNFYAGIETNKAGSGDVIVNGNGATICGLGTAAAPLASVRFDNSATVEDGAYAADMRVAPGQTASFKDGDVVGSALLLEGAASTASFNNVPILNTRITTQVAKEGIVNFSGGISIEQEIGTKDKPLAEINFTAKESEIYDVKTDIHALKANLNGAKIQVGGNQEVVTFDFSLLAEKSQFVIESGTRLRFDPTDIVISEISDSTFEISVSDTGASGIEIAQQVIFGDDVTFRVNDDLPLPGSEPDQIEVIFDGNQNLTIQGEEGIKIIDEKREFVQHEIIDNNLIRTNVAVEKMTEIAPEDTNADEIGVIFNPDNTGEARAFAQDVEEVLSNNGQAAAKDYTDNVSSVEGYVADHSIQRPSSEAIYSRIAEILAPAASDEKNIKLGFWASPFFSIATQKTDGKYSGYLMRSFGGIFGVDTMISDRALIGASIGVGSDHATYKDAKKGSLASINNMIYSIYGSYDFVNNWTVAGNASLSTDSVTITEPRGPGNAPARTKYKSRQYNAELTGGYNFKLSDRLTITPLLGYMQSYRTKIEYTQTGEQGGNRTHQTNSLRRHEAIYGLRVAHKMNIGKINLDNTFTLKGNYNFGNNVVETNSQIPGTVTALPKRYTTLPRHTMLAGLESKIQTGRFEYSVKYDLMRYKKYTSHTGSLKLKVNL